MSAFKAKESYQKWTEQSQITPGEWMGMIRETYGLSAQQGFWQVFKIEHVKPKDLKLFR